MIRSSVKPGDRKILADEYNLFLRNSRRPQGVPGGTLEEMYPPTICYVRNDTAFTCDAFTVLGLNGPVITRADNDVEFRNSITFKGVTPDSDEHTGKYCILQEPIKSGEIGRAVMSGVSWCQLNITADTDTAAEIEDGTRSYLKTGGSGSAKILYMESGTGTNKWGLVYLYCCSEKPKVAWLSTARTSYTYTGGGAEKEVQFTGAWNASDGEFDTLQTVPSSGYYTKIELTKPGIYETHAHVAFDSSGWSYTTISSSLGDAFDEASLRIEAKDKNGDTIDATLKRQWTIVLSNYKFSLSTGGIMLLNILPTLFPVTVRVLAFSNTYDFTAQAVSGSFYVKSIREELD